MEQNKCINGECPRGMDKIREIVLTPSEKRAIFHSILNLAKTSPSPEKREEVFAEPVSKA